MYSIPVVQLTHTNIYFLNNFPAFLEPHLITGKIIQCKYQIVLELLQYSEKWVWPCHAPLSALPCSTKFPKLVQTNTYSMQNESCKNIQPFSCSNFVNNQGFKKWAWPCHAPHDADRASTVHWRILLMYTDPL